MFGYVRPSKSVLTTENAELFRAYYCGLCKGIGKKFFLARLGLSYDLTFLLILLSALSEEEPAFDNSRCVLHRCKKERILKESKALEFVSDISILLTFKKLQDDFRDDKNFLAFLGMILFGIAKKRIKNINKEKRIEEELKRLSKLEKENSSDIDEVADAFSKICEEIFVPNFVEDENERKTLAFLGYNIGRWIYLIDAIDDLAKDIKTKSYNPYKEKFFKMGKKDFLADAEEGLTFTLSNISAAYDILDIKRNNGILENIIYAGLFDMQKSIFKKQEDENGSL